MKHLKAYFDLGKLRLSLLVTATALAGYLLGNHGAWSGPLLAALLGTLLSSMGANGINQWMERERDAKMHRTALRPIPSGRLTPRLALELALLSCAAGVVILAISVNLLTAALSLLTILLYTLVYTPLKPVSPSNTLVGALVGAIPPIMGWTAATGHFAYGALALGAILFVWQIPHFLGLAWLYREDYARGGYRMLSLSDDGSATGWMMLVYSLALIPVALLLSVGRVSGWAYALGSIVLGIAMAGFSWRFYFERSNSSARRVFIASLAYLPLLLVLMVASVRPPSTTVYITQPDSPAAPVVPAGVLEARAGE
ncbi:MAG: heme o synthase [bacterium]|nr:heme o synthase [bacterium]